jgi:hypothetical protein
MIYRLNILENERMVNDGTPLLDGYVGVLR